MMLRSSPGPRPLNHIASLVMSSHDAFFLSAHVSQSCPFMSSHQDQRTQEPGTYFLLSPAEDAAQQRSVEALGGSQAPLHLPNGHLVLGVGAEQREATRDRAEDLGRVGQSGEAEALLPHAQGREGRAVQLGREGNCGGSREAP